MQGDIVQMGAYIGAGLACMGLGGSAIGAVPQPMSIASSRW